MRISKRIIAALLTAVLVFGLVPVNAFAQETDPQTNVDQSDLTVEGTNSFGTLLSEDIISYQSEASEEEAEYSGEYTVTGLEIEGTTATVTYCTPEDALLVVALYTENGLRLMNSAKTEVSAEETTAQVTFEGTIPQYFMASAYLLDVYDASPLCASYDTPMYTREMQELLASTVEDYDADRVLNLDDDPTTNFAVFAESTIVIEGMEGVNTVVSADDENFTYVIENADESITSLQAGEVFAYLYGEDEILIVKVASITVDGTTATITGTELEMEEVFSHVKIESTNSTEDIAVDDTEADEGVAYDGLYGGIQTFAWDGNESIKTSHGFLISKKVPVNTGSGAVEAEVSVSGSVKLNLSMNLSYYISTSRQFLEFKVNTGIDLSIKVTGEVKINMLKLGVFECSPVAGVFIRMRPYAQLRFSGEVSFTVSYTSTVGFSLEHTKNGFSYRDLRTSPKPSAAFTFEGTVFFGVDLHPEIVIISDKIASAELEGMVGLEVKSSLSIIDKSDPNALEVHRCSRCYDGDISVVFKISIKVQFLKMEKLKVAADLLERTWKIADYYYSADNSEFGWKDCPYRAYRVTVVLADDALPDRADIAVSAYHLEDKTETELGTTNSDGIVTAYLKAGSYIFQAESGDTEYRTPQTLTQSCKVLLVKAGTATGSGTTGSVIQGSVDSDDLKVYHFGTPVESGYCGDQGSNLTWALYEGQVLYITGKGRMQDWEPYYSPFYGCEYGKYLEVYIGNGVTSIGKNAFSDRSGSMTVFMPKSVTDIADGAFLNTEVRFVVDEDNSVFSTSDDGYILYKNNTTLSCVSKSFSGSYTIPEHVTAISGFAFAGCSKVTDLVITDQVTSIGDGAFYRTSFPITLSENNPVFRTDQDGAVFIKNNTELVFAHKRLSGSYTIPDSVTSIRPYAFGLCANVEAVSIPESVTRIEDNTFIGCGITSMIIPNSLTQIGDYAFKNCGKLKEIIIPYGVTTIGKNAFEGCSALGTVEIPSSVTSIGAYAFYDSFGKNGTVYIPSSLTNIGEYAFLNCKGYVVVEEGNPVYSNDQDGRVLIKNKTTLEWASVSGTYTIPDGVTTIGSHAFCGCDGLSRVVIPDSVTTIGRSAFLGCFLLDTINIPGSVTSIGEDIFDGCTYLRAVSIQEGVTSIPDELFRSCTELETVRIPVSVTYIGKYAFINCRKLTDVYYSGTQEQWDAINIEEYNPRLSDCTIHFRNAVAASAEAQTVAEDLEYAEVVQDAPVTYAVWNGNYAEETLGNYRVKTASFTGLVPGTDYVLLVVESMDKEDILAPSNLLFIRQGTAAEDGTLAFQYMPRSYVQTSYAMAVGPSHRNLKDAVITFPEMHEFDGEQVVNPTVVYDGKTLTEGQDYILLGTVYVGKPGTYPCTVRGISEYTGLVNCTYTVAAHDHVFTDYTSDNNATCTADGTKTAKCDYCEEQNTVTDAGSMLSHSYNSKVTDPTCTEKGYTTHTCSACGDTYTDGETPALKHDFGDWVVTKEATVDAEGEKTRTCTRCPETESDVIPKLEGTEPSEDPTEPEETEPEETEPKEEWINPFEDVMEDKFYYEPVLWAYYGGITTGKDATHFNPSGFCTRSQVVTFLWRAAGQPEPASSENPFPDVPEGKFYTKAVLWAVEQGITAGFKDGTFGPNDACTRGQIVTFLWRYFGEPEPASSENPFPDVVESKFYYKAVLWAVENEITGGFKDGTFGPNKTCTRDQIVTFLYRAMVE